MLASPCVSATGADDATRKSHKPETFIVKNAGSSVYGSTRRPRAMDDSSPSRFRHKATPRA